MIIKLSPVRSDASLSVVRAGDTLEINGIVFDFSRLPDGATLPAAAVGSTEVLDPIERVSGKIVVTIRLPHAADADRSSRFPADIIDPMDGQVRLPGIELSGAQPSVAGVIDWSQVVTAEQKTQAAAEQLLSIAAAEITQRRGIADAAIVPLQDAIDLDEATEAELALLKEWKRYRVALNRLPEQPGYPATIDWPVPPT
ncbi:tail fiber assembly protein [Pseudomonas japonica]|uniref:Virus tail fibre assembly protein, lambda gpK n=1 Tax=Pseudomonas japonica TaxID=256466 RepID=A0A239BTT5_9PSED|nr:tail fiber assembly protein [Pseudomonas japonica]SNS10828.1 virus tail fibre assembly protein, lambda gpK [Pseudomonas japonica]